MKLPVYWASNKTAWMTATLFENWYTNHFLPAVKYYCKRKKLEFKILLLVDNCTGHPDLSHLDPNVRMEFLPANTTSLIQPMDQGAISTFKALYKRITFSKAHETHQTLTEFLREYTILDAIPNIAKACSDVTPKNMKGVWNKILSRTREDQIVHESPLEQIVEEIVNLGHQVGADLEKEDIEEGLMFDNKDLSDELLYELSQDKADVEEVEKPKEKLDDKNISLDQLGVILSKANELCDLIKDLDPVNERRLEVENGIQDLIKVYKDEQKSLKEKETAKKRKQTDIGSFLIKKPKQ